MRSNFIYDFEFKNISSALVKERKSLYFLSGYTLRVGVKLSFINSSDKQKTNENRVQYFEGIVIAKRNKGLMSSFVLRKVSFSEIVEKTFLLYSPVLYSISIIKIGKVRRAKLFYLRDLKGKAARIKDKKLINIT